MAVKSSKGLKVNYLIIFLSGLVLLTTGILVFLLVVKNVYGNYEIEEILPSKENITLLTGDPAKKIGILYSDYTQNMMPEGSTWLSDNVDTWEHFINSLHYQYDIISDQEIEQGEHYKYKLLILPGSKSMSDKELVQLKKYLENGGSIFCTGGPSTYSDEGKWRGWEFFTEAFGMKFNKEIKPEEFYKVHTLRGNLPLTAGIPTGYTLKIATWDRPIYAEILEPRTTQVSFWFDFRREAGLVREAIQKSAGIAYGTYGRGRFVWYGFEINSVIGEQEDYIYFEKLFTNSINWLTYGPTAFVKDWPEKYNAAMIFIPTVSENVYNLTNANGLLSTQKYPATFFVDPLVAKANSGLIKSASSYGQIGTIVDIGYLENAQDTVNKLYDADVQLENLRSARDTIVKYIGKDVKSVMPLNGFYNESTLQAMSKLGYEFLITDSLTDRSVPKVVIRNNNQMLVITKTARDDIEVVGKYGLTNTDFQRYTYEEDVDRLLFEGGLLVFKAHTRYQLQQQYINVIKDIINYARNNKVWLTSLPELQQWWLKRHGVEIIYETRSKRRIVVEINNPTEEKSEEITVQVNLNKPVKNIEISSEIIGTTLPRYEFDEDTNILYLYLDELEANESRSYLVDFENIGDS